MLSLPPSSQAELNELDYVAKHDLASFAAHALGYHNPAEHHSEWYDVLQNRLTSPENADDIDQALIDAPEGTHNDRIMIMAPRSHAKSTCFTVNYPLWEIGNNPNVRILLVSAALSQSTSFLREIKGHMMRNQTYRRVFGDLFPDDLKNAEKWTNTEIIVNRSNTKIKDPTVGAVSAGGTILSKRADIIICDDILDDGNTRTADQRAHMEAWFYETLLPVLEPNGRLIVVGTAWNLEDLYHKLIKQPTFKVRKRYKAILDETTQEVLWKSRWSYETLMIRKAESGSHAFNKSYQNEAIASEDAVFQPEWVRAAKDKGLNRTLIPYLDYAKWDLGKMTITCGIDLAISQKDNSDFTAMVVIGRTKDGMKIPLFMLRDKLSPKQTKDWIISINERFQPDMFMVETNGYQAALQRDLADTTDLPIKGYTTGGEKFDVDIGLNSIAVEMENEKWIFPYSQTDPETIRLIDYLSEGLLKFPSGHTEDLAMAMWFANNAMRDLTASKKTMTTGSFSGLIG
jgi:phage terminase large subunit-like protein